MKSGSQILAFSCLILVFIAAFWVRIIDLDDPPLDFNPTRQLRSAIIARGLYYRSAPDVDLEKRTLAINHWSGMEQIGRAHV